MTTGRSPHVTRQCGQTGLRLVPTAGRHTSRIAKPSFGPLNPPLREAGTRSVDSWARWDTPAGRTIYVADSEETSYRELLAYLAPSVGVRNTKLSDVFTEEEEAKEDARSLLEAITQDWDSLWWTTPHKIVQGWRDARRLYTLALPQQGWVVDVEHQDSVDALNRGLAQQLASMGMPRLTCGHLRGEDRRHTTLAAEWIRSQILDDGTYPHGITFPSKHGSNRTCWAIWLHRIDDGHAPEKEPTKVIDQEPIAAPTQNLALKATADAFGLTIL